jgi:hypothetical protein
VEVIEGRARIGGRAYSSDVPPPGLKAGDPDPEVTMRAAEDGVFEGVDRGAHWVQS